MKALASFTLVLVACGGAEPTRNAAVVQQQATFRGGNDVTTDASGRSRAELDRLLAAYDRADGAGKLELADAIDKMAGQRHATVSRLFWYTDLASARAEARATGKPILSLRLLGRLDEEMSCANSRFFRTILYPDPEVGAVLRDRFVLHWSSERPVPKMTIDFGDGRKLERTITGNSIHYVLDADGNPIDGLPGLYAPQVFRAALERSLALHREMSKNKGLDRDRVLATHHEKQIGEIDAKWKQLGPSVVLDWGNARLLSRTEIPTAVERAQRATVSKMRIEAPDLAQVAIGDLKTFTADATSWSIIGFALYDLGTPPPDDSAGFARRTDGAKPRAGKPMLSAPSRALIGGMLRDGVDRDRMLARIEWNVLGDTAINELQIRRSIHARLKAFPSPSFDQLNEMVYAELFAMPKSDAWAGLLSDDVFTGITGDGVVTLAR
jgi:hypothetical protein